MISRRELWEYRKKRSNHFLGWGKVWSGGCTGWRRKIIFWYRKKVARTGTPWLQSRALPGLVHYRRPALSFLAKVGPPRRLTRRARPAVPYPARLLPARTRCRVTVLLRCPDLPGPARCSRDTAKVAVFRLASSHPQPETLPRGYPNDCPSLSRAGGAKREAGRGRSGPNEHRFRVRR